VLFISCAVSSVLGFEPQLEPFSHGKCCASQTSRLYSSKPESNHRDDIDRSSRLQTSDSDFAPGSLFGALDDLSLLFDQDAFDGIFPILQEQTDALATETFEEIESLEFNGLDYCGDDCKECEIPNDWCVPGETIDVMEYLGVTRVKPLC